MPQFDLCLAWNWQYDQDFVHLLEAACDERGLALLQVTPHNLTSTIDAVQNGEIECTAILDRASDEDHCFLPLVAWAEQQVPYHVNPFHKARRAWNKASMHLRLLQAGLNSPNTIVLPSYESKPGVPPVNLDVLGETFTIKPAHGGGMRGVVNQANSWDQVLAARQEFPHDQYLLQSNVVPRRLSERLAWFRVIYCAGEVLPCWWDLQTHAYTPLGREEMQANVLRPLWDITHTIARLTNLDLFSSEIAMVDCGEFYVVDYVNDPVDLRLQSKVVDGIPDNMAWGIARRLAQTVEQHKSLAAD